jgi:hypothetical protein
MVKINTTDITDYLVDWKYSKTFGDIISTINITFTSNVYDVLDITNGQIIEIWEGYTTSTDTKIFKGYVTSVTWSGNKAEVKAEDMLYTLKRKEVTYSYDADIDASAGVISEIFEDLVETWGGMTCTVQDSGTTLILKKYICDHTNIFERCKKLAEVLDWQFYYDADDDTVYFEPKGYENNDTVLRTDTNIVNAPKWEYDSSMLCNDVTVIGASQLIESTYITSGVGGAGSIFTLPSKPESVKVYVDSTLQEGTIEGDNTSGTYDYYVDYEKKRIRFDSASVPGSSAAGIEIRYTRNMPVPVRAFDEASKSAYQEHRKTIFETDIRDVNDAESRASNYIIKYATPFVSSTLDVRNVSTGSIYVGQKIRVIDSVNAEDRWVVINRMTYQYPGKYDVLEVGDKTFRLADWGIKIAENMQNLNAEAAQNQNYLLHVVNHTGSFSIARYDYYIWRRAMGSSFVLGHNVAPEYSLGLLGTAGAGSQQPYLGDSRGASGCVGSYIY